jgi:hypothetical protein
MPLDPQVSAFLAEAAEAGATPFQHLTPAEARVAISASKDLSGEPEAVSGVWHDFIPGPTADLPVRLYRPINCSEDQPLARSGLLPRRGMGHQQYRSGGCRESGDQQPHRLCLGGGELSEGTGAQVPHPLR